MTQADTTCDILMITYNRAAYTRLSLGRLLETCDEHMRVWVWHNGDDAETLAVVDEYAGHRRIHRVHRSPENRKLRDPTNWMWSESDAPIVGKVDDDCLVPHGWGETLRQAHAANPQFGVLGCWHFRDEDFVPELAHRKIASFEGGHRLMRNCWTGGSGYLMKRACIESEGLLREDDSFPRYCIRLAAKGWINGWYYPFLFQEHMDDPRAPHTLLKCDADLKEHLPLSAEANGVTLLAEWDAQLRRSARLLQEVSPDPRHHIGWRSKLRAVRRRLWRLAGVSQQW